MRNFFLTLALIILPTFAFSDPLPSWNEGPIKKSIIEFVETVTNKNNPQFVPVAERIATFDNDGTLWVEQPLYTQVIYSIDRLKTLALSHPEWKKQPPFSIILSGDKKAMAALTPKDMEKLLAVTHTGMSVDDFMKITKAWFSTAKNPHFNRLYTQTTYRPMLEVMKYLREHEFQIYIVTGGGQEFVRAMSSEVYEVEVNHVIGTTSKTTYTYQNKNPVLIKTAELLVLDDKTGKPESINLFIGRKPLIAFGNSDGDREMLEWTQSREGAHLMLLVHHDDAEREYAYGPNSKIGTFSDSLMAHAQHNGWKIISMKHDWKEVFSPITPSTNHD